MTDRRSLRSDDRAVSIAVTHVMTIGITTILISGLLIGAAGMLDGQRDRAGSTELQSIGDRTAAELVTAAAQGERTDSNVTVRSRQPEYSVGGSYVVELTNRSDCNVRSGYDGCLELTASSEDLSVEVPVTVPEGVSIENGTSQSGRVVVAYDRTDRSVTIRGESA